MSESLRLNGLTALVTGAGRGIGEQVAMTLAAEGAAVVVNDLGCEVDGEGVEHNVADGVVERIVAAGGRAASNADSVADYDGAGRMIQTAVDTFGSIDILVNVAGIERAAMIFNMTPEAWQAVIDVHLTGTFNTTRHATQIMRAQGSGRIINFSSDAWTGTLGHANYGAAKGGIASLTFAVAREMGKYGVTVNAVAPVASTRMTLSDDVRAGLVKRFEQGHISREQLDEALDMPSPEHIGPFIAYLASPAAGDINGQVFHVEASRIARYSLPVEGQSLYRDWRTHGPWTVEDLTRLAPVTLLQNYVNPAPAKAE